MKAGRHRHGPGKPRWRWTLLGLGAGGVIAAVALVLGIGQVTGSLACAAVLSSAGQAGAAAAGPQSATHYVLQGLPNCSYPAPPADGLYAALPAAEYAGAARCGGYLEVTGPGGSVRVKVVDQCPECAAGHVDLSEAAFARIAPLSAGLVSVSYAALTDPVLPGPLSIEVKQGSSQYWLALLADNTGNPLASVQVRTATGWLPLVRASYNYWIAQSGAGQGPFTVRLTDSQGHQVTVPGVTLTPGSVQSTQTWMYGPGASQAAPAASSSMTSSEATPATPATSPTAAPSPATPRTPAFPSLSPVATRPAADRVTDTQMSLTARDRCL